MHNIFNNEQKALLNLPPKNDTEAESLAHYNFPEGLLKFEGQEFIFPDGFNVDVIAKWLEESLLSVEIEVDAVIQSECARCLKVTSLEISENLGYLYYLHGAEEEAVDDFGDYMPVEIDYFGKVIDIMPQIQESVFTLLPTKVLCREDCKGLCPNCGADLNEGPCSCKIESVDPRLEALRNFVVE